MLNAQSPTWLNWLDTNQTIPNRLSPSNVPLGDTVMIIVGSVKRNSLGKCRESWKNSHNIAWCLNMRYISYINYKLHITLKQNRVSMKKRSCLPTYILELENDRGLWWCSSWHTGLAIKRPGFNPGLCPTNV